MEIGIHVVWNSGGSVMSSLFQWKCSLSFDSLDCCVKLSHICLQKELHELPLQP